MIIPVIVLTIVFFLIIAGKTVSPRLEIWQIMALGALAVLVMRQISFTEALSSIDPDVMLFLSGMFIIGQALEMSGYLESLSYSLFRHAKSADVLILSILFGMGLASAFLMNDTLAIIGTPVVLALAKEHHINPKILLLALAFAVTTGSVISPIGNPQNLLIALGSGMENPFIAFTGTLIIPTAVNMLLAYLFIRLFFRKHFHSCPLTYSKKTITDPRLARLSRIALWCIILLVCVRIILAFSSIQFDFKLTYIALIASLPVLLFSRRRTEIIKGMDWHTLIFFASMFILMKSVWNSGFFQMMIDNSIADITSIPMILAISMILSQLISNVPLVALYMPILLNTGITDNGLLALAAGSTIAGNFSILGAASNVIIIQNAQRKGNVPISFSEFAVIGMPLTIVQILVYWMFLH